MNWHECLKWFLIGIFGGLGWWAVNFILSLLIKR